MTTREQVLSEITHEREHQDAKWGVQNHSPIHWCAILGEEVGEVNKAALEAHFAESNDLSEYRKELIQVAAVAVAMIECLDRNVEVRQSGQMTYEDWLTRRVFYQAGKYITDEEWESHEMRGVRYLSMMMIKEAKKEQRELSAVIFEGFGEFPPEKTEVLKQAILNAEVVI
jgi:NTP pyrophosphatase (non-canonical NTP hydrolase)